MIGLVQAVAVAPSSEQAKVAGLPLAWNANVADALVVPAVGVLSR